MLKKTNLLITVLFFAAGSLYAQKPGYSDTQGHLKFISKHIAMDQLKPTDVRTDTIRVLNDWTQPMKLDFRDVPAYLTVTALPQELPPGGSGIIVVKFDAAKRNDWGLSYQAYPIFTNDSLNAIKYFSIGVNIVEDFGSLTDAQRANAPKAFFPEKEHKFGDVKQGNKAVYDFVVTNQGKSELIIRKTKASCGCTATNPEKSVLKPGESSKINVAFSSTGYKGFQAKTVTVICNDPDNPVTTLMITSNVVQE